MRRNPGITPFLSLSVAVLMGLLAFTACQSGTGRASLDTEDQKASYGVGYQLGGQLTPAQSHLDLDALLMGIRDGMEGSEPALSVAEIQAAMDTLNTTVLEEETTRRTAEAEKNEAEGAAFMADNAQKEGVHVTESGLQYEVLREGDGASPTADDRVSVHYRGTLIDGTEFDTSYGGDPASFAVTGVIDGFGEGLQLMTVGSQYRFVIPAEIAYGAQGSRSIGPNATLIFEVELLGILD